MSVEDDTGIAIRRLRGRWARNFPRLERIRLGDEELDVRGTAHYLREAYVGENLDDMLADMSEERMDDCERVGMRPRDFL